MRGAKNNLLKMNLKYILTISLKQIKVLNVNPVESFMSECVEMSNEDLENVNGVKWYKVEYIY